LKGFTPKESQQFKTGILILNCLLAIVALMLCQNWSKGSYVSVVRLNILGIVCVLNLLVTVIMLARLKRWSTEFWVFLALLIFISGPITTFTTGYIFNRLTDKDFKFSQGVRNYLSFYKHNDIWIFEDSRFRKDTFQVTSVDSEEHIPAIINFLGPGPSKSISIGFKKISSDNFSGLNNGVLRIDSKSQGDNGYITLAFFHRFTNWWNSDSIGVLKSDTLRVSNILFNKYRYIESRLSDLRNLDESDSLDIISIYWTNEYGIIAYKYKNGDLWKRINLH
jgi:hypothetical protein